MPTFLRVYFLAAVLPMIMVLGCQTGKWVHPELSEEAAKARLETDTQYCSHEPMTSGVALGPVATYRSNKDDVTAMCLEKRGWRWTPDR